MLADSDLLYPGKRPTSAAAGRAFRSNEGWHVEMTRLRVVAVDDEPLALRRAELLLSRVDEVSLVGTARDADEALALVTSVEPDVILLDVTLAGTTGFDLLEQLPVAQARHVIFVSAHDRFAARAFEVGALDYLVKPMELDRLRSSLEKARRAIALADTESSVAEMRTVIAALRDQQSTSTIRPYEKEIWAEQRGDFYPVRVDEIRWIEAQGDYVRLYAGDQAYLLRETITRMVERLDPQKFVRVRRSAIVRLDAVRTIQAAGYGHFRLKLIHGEDVRVGRTYLKAVRALISGRPPG